MEIVKTVSYNPLTKMYCNYVIDESDNVITIVNGQDCLPILEYCKRMREMEQFNDYKNTGIEAETVCIPVTIDAQLVERGIIHGTKDWLRWVEKNPWWKCTNKRLI